MTSFRVWLIGSLVLAAVAAGLPFVTHFADGGLSIMAVVFWLAAVVVGLFRFGWRGLWLLLGAPLALFWVFALVWVAPDLHLSF